MNIILGILVLLVVVLSTMYLLSDVSLEEDSAVKNENSYTGHFSLSCGSPDSNCSIKNQE